MKAARLLKVLGISLLVGLALLFKWQAHERAAETRDRELVRAVESGGHTYSLYFHRKAAFYNTIRKDGEVVFDSRDHPELQPCLQELVLIGTRVHRRCYLSLQKRVVSAPLP